MESSQEAPIANVPAVEEAASTNEQADASLLPRIKGSGANRSPARRDTLVFGSLRHNGERTEEHRGVVSRAALSPRGDHPLRALVFALQAQLSRFSRDDV